MWFTALIPLLSGLFGENSPIGQYFKTKALQVQATADLELQVEKDKFGLSMEMAQAGIESQKAELSATSAFTKAVILICVNIPVFITCLHAPWGAAIFSAFQQVPQWYAMLDVAIIGVVFGLPIANNWMSTVYTGIQDMWDQKHQRKLEVISANGQAASINLEQAKSQIFDILKNTVHLSGYTQGQVEAINKVLDPVLKQVSGQ